MSIYVIDYENTSVAGLNGIERLLDTDVVVVFFSTNAPKIDIKAVEEPEAEESFDEKKNRVTKDLSAQLGIPVEDAEILVNNGFLSIDGLKAVQVADLEAIEGLAPETVSTILEKLAKQNGADSSL